MLTYPQMNTEVSGGRVVGEPNGREFYIPHKPVKNKSAETTNLRIVFEASAKPKEDNPSLNECLEDQTSLAEPVVGCTSAKPVKASRFGGGP